MSFDDSIMDMHDLTYRINMIFHVSGPSIFTQIVASILGAIPKRPLETHFSFKRSPRDGRSNAGPGLLTVLAPHDPPNHPKSYFDRFQWIGDRCWIDSVGVFWRATQTSKCAIQALANYGLQVG